MVEAMEMVEGLIGCSDDFSGKKMVVVTGFDEGLDDRAMLKGGQRKKRGKRFTEAHVGMVGGSEL